VLSASGDAGTTQIAGHRAVLGSQINAQSHTSAAATNNGKQRSVVTRIFEPTACRSTYIPVTGLVRGGTVPSVRLAEDDKASWTAVAHCRLSIWLVRYRWLIGYGFPQFCVSSITMDATA
jgi:hypothetical protein